MEEKIFSFIESPSTWQRLTKVVSEVYQEIKANPKKFITNLFSKDKAKGRQHLRVGLAGAVFCWLFGTIIYIGIYFWQPVDLDNTEEVQLITKLIALPPVKPKLPPVKAANRASGGGGGGRHEMSPPPDGKLPIAELKNAIVAPTTHPPEIKTPILPVVPTINVQPDLMPKQDNNIPIGLPTGVAGPPSDGIGDNGGIGSGKNGGVGRGNGDGYGDGDGGNRGGGPRKIGGGDDIYTPSMGIRNPIITYKQKPRYTEDARAGKIQGEVVLSVVLRRDGTITDIKVVRGLGYGLDEEAIRAATKIQFIPGTKNNESVNVKVRLEFSFQLL